MSYSQLCMLLSLSILLSSSSEAESSLEIRASVFLSPPFSLKPGSVTKKFYLDIPFPRGHIALKRFDGELADENGGPVPLREAYLHHWAVHRYHAAAHGPSQKFIHVRNSGPCGNLAQYFGIGAETRKTNTWVPDPYGIVVGNPNEIPAGYEEKWLLELHAIDTRSVEDRLGCTECRCGLYNVSSDERRRPLAEGYVGGLHCCYDGTRCRVRRGLIGDGTVRKLYLRYRVEWVEWSPRILGVRIYILDVTDTGSERDPNRCKVEYSVPSCHSGAGEANGDHCVHMRKAKVRFPHGGDVIYGVAHQHIGGLGSALYGEDGEQLCSSHPIYGKGNEIGDEAGYVEGMSACYPKPGSMKIRDGELLTLVSNYSSLRMHTGVMGLFHIFLAEAQVNESNAMKG